MSGQIRKPRSKKATPAFFAAMTFTDQGPALREAIGTREEWLHQAAQEWLLFRFAEVIQRKDQDELAAAVAAMPDEIVEMAKSFEAAQERFRGMADVLDSTVVRIMCGLARLEVAESGG